MSHTHWNSGRKDCCVVVFSGSPPTTKQQFFLFWFVSLVDSTTLEECCCCLEQQQQFGKREEKSIQDGNQRERKFQTNYTRWQLWPWKSSSSSSWPARQDKKSGKVKHDRRPGRVVATRVTRSSLRSQLPSRWPAGPPYRGRCRKTGKRERERKNGVKERGGVQKVGGRGGFGYPPWPQRCQTAPNNTNTRQQHTQLANNIGSGVGTWYR